MTPFAALLGVIALTSCSRTMQHTGYSYLALGDSYTIGEAVNPNDRWPNQLVARLREKGVEINEPEIIARTGWTRKPPAATGTGSSVRE